MWVSVWCVGEGVGMREGVNMSVSVYVGEGVDINVGEGVDVAVSESVGESVGIGMVWVS